MPMYPETVLISTAGNTVSVSSGSITLSSNQVSVVNAPSVTVANAPSVTVANAPSVTVASMPSVTVSGSVSVANAPTVSAAPLPHTVSSFNTYGSATISKTGTLQSVLSANTLRTRCGVYNAGVSLMYLHFGTETGATSTLALFPLPTGVTTMYMHNMLGDDVVYQGAITVSGTTADTYYFFETV
jgi:hypothetical protein